MKRFLLFFVSVFLGSNLLNAQEGIEVSIGTDAGDYSTTYDMPFEEYNAYSLSQQIFTAEEMGGNVGDIIQLSFKMVYCSNSPVRVVDVYMVNTDKTSFTSGSDWVSVTEDDLVYSGDVAYPPQFENSYSGVAWMDIKFQTSFKYEGGNILVCCNDRTGDATLKEVGFATYQPSECRAIMARGGTPYSVDELYFATGEMKQNNQIKFLVAEEPEIVPTAPANLTATTIDANSIKLTWDAVESAATYDLYRGEELVANLSELEYLDENLEPNTEYCYVVKTLYEDGSESDPTEEVCATTLELEPVEPECVTPTNLVAEVEGETSVRLTWDAAENALSYNVYKDGELLTNVEETSYLIENLEYNTEYCFAVSSVRNEQESAKTDDVCVKTLDASIAENQKAVAIYPNPVKEQLFINMEEEIDEVSVYNLTGAMVYGSNEVKNNTINVAGLVNGAYIIKVKTANAEYVQRFIKK